jgi:fatty acid CoA ligase FadD36
MVPDPPRRAPTPGRPGAVCQPGAMVDDVLLPALAGRFPDSPEAVRVADEATSWAALADRAAAVAARLQGARSAAVSAAATLDTIVAVAAGLAAGVPVVPVPADSGPVERGHVVRDSGAEVVLGDPDWADVDLPRVPLHGGPAGAGLPEPPADAAAFIVYTSGTTGPPKGAVLSRRAVAADLDALAEAWGWTPADHLVHGLPLFHVHGLILGVLGALRAGSRLTHTGRPTPDAYAAAGGTLYFGVPTVWNRVCAEPDAAVALRGARLLVSGSAALPVAVFERMAQLTGQSPVERYGMTETLITVSARADGERRAGHVGLPLPGIATRVVGDHGEVLPADGASVGNLQVRGATLFEGYLGQPDKTAACYTADGWFVTGDAAVIGPDGVHRIVGRTSTDIIKSGGYKVGAGEVEAALLDHPAVSEAAVVGEPDDDLGQRIVAYVVADGVDGPALVAFVASRLSVHKRPREVRLVASLPRNAMGKVQKTLLGR